MLLFCLSVAIHAQLAAPNPSGVTMGHVHLYTKDTEAQKKFWVGALAAQETKLGGMQVFKLPGVLIMLDKTDQAGRGGGTEGSVINHVGFKVRDLSWPSSNPLTSRSLFAIRLRPWFSPRTASAWS